MFTFTFFKKAVGLGIATTLAFFVDITLAMAEKPEAVCLPADKAQIKALKEYLPLIVIDFTESSESCLNKYADSFSYTDLVHVVKDEDQEARNIVRDVATIHNGENHPSVVFYGHPDPLGAEHNVAMNDIWKNGGKRSSPIAVDAQHTISMLDSLHPDVQIERAKIVQDMLKDGHHVLDIVNGVKH